MQLMKHLDTVKIETYRQKEFYHTILKNIHITKCCNFLLQYMNKIEKMQPNLANISWSNLKNIHKTNNAQLIDPGQNGKSPSCIPNSARKSSMTVCMYLYDMFLDMTVSFF